MNEHKLLHNDVKTNQRNHAGTTKNKYFNPEIAIIIHKKNVSTHKCFKS